MFSFLLLRLINMPKTDVPLPETFEAGLNELEALIQTLETGELPLEAQMNVYARGTVLLKFCETCLNKAEQQIKVLTADNTLVDLDTLQDK
jgi:exodeoxyribonuclease VII small subunit